MLILSIKNSLDELVHLLGQLKNEEYSTPCVELSNASIGEHTRHIIEMFQCLENQYESGVLNYDKRPRSTSIQNNTQIAILAIFEIRKSLEKENKKIDLQQNIDSVPIRIESNYFRELLYNLEHCIHHQALIKVALLKYENVSIDVNFGVARSTIEYRNQCVQ